ncbi:MAG: hypothetical protein HQM08_29515 [Candidatus Riflebacteria bacterium]|nr:hypothetical protein [Candidatus Riflebacteria bacterium]
MPYNRYFQVFVLVFLMFPGFVFSQGTSTQWLRLPDSSHIPYTGLDYSSFRNRAGKVNERNNLSLNSSVSRNECQNRMKKIQLSLTLYNRDHLENCIVEINSETLNRLLTSKYLNGNSTCPSNGVYSSSGNLMLNGKITCSIHGEMTKPSGNAMVSQPGEICNRNIKILLGAIEMYNLDNPKMISQLTDETIKVLIKGGYLKKELFCPENGKYVCEGDLTRDGTVKCSVHAAKAESTGSGTGNPSNDVCCKNLVSILGAIEMYNCDNTPGISTITPDTLNMLVRGHYLKEELSCPEKGEYYSEGDLSKDGKIKCRVHDISVQVEHCTSSEANNSEAIKNFNEGQRRTEEMFQKALEKGIIIERNCPVPPEHQGYPDEKKK